MAFNVAIRPVDLVEAEAVYAMRRQPLVQRLTTAMPEDTLEQTERFQADLDPNDVVVRSVIAGLPVGMAGLDRGSGKSRQMARLDIKVHDDWHGQGLERSLMTHMLHEADEVLNLDRVQLDVMADNEWAIRMYERLGFEIEGMMRAAVRRPDGDVDVLVMGRLRSEIV